MKSIELVEFYLESGKPELESVHKRIGTGNTPIFLVFESFWHFSGVRGGLIEKLSE